MSRSIKRVAIYCGAGVGNDPIYVAEAQRITRMIHKKGWSIVYGGGSIGIMNAVAEEMLSLGGEVYGVITEKLMSYEVGHTALTELIIVETMAERKLKMAEMADAYIALPGGVGTLEEIIETFVLTQLGYHHKPVAFLNTKKYYHFLNAWFEHAVSEGFLRRHMKDTIIVESDPETLIARLETVKTMSIEDFYETRDKDSDKSAE